MTNTKISHKQLMALMFVSLLSPMIRSIPDGEIGAADHLAWLAPIVAAVPILILYGLMRCVLKRGAGLGELMLKNFGAVFGRVVLVIYALWLGLYTGLVLRVAGERLVSYVYNDTSWVIFASVILLASSVAAMGRVKSLARTARVFVPIVAAVLIVVFLCLGDDIRLENLLPVTYYDVPSILLAGLRLAGTMSVIGYYAFLYGEVDAQKSRGGIGYLAALIFVTLAVAVSTIGVLSAEVARTMQSPFFVIIRNITFFNVLERIEAVVIALWVISDFVYVGSMLTISADLMRLTANTKTRVPWVIAAAALSMTAAVLVARSAFDLERLVLYVAPAVNSVLVVVGVGCGMKN